MQVGSMFPVVRQQRSQFCGLCSSHESFSVGQDQNKVKTNKSVRTLPVNIRLSGLESGVVSSGSCTVYNLSIRVSTVGFPAPQPLGNKRRDFVLIKQCRLSTTYPYVVRFTVVS